MKFVRGLICLATLACSISAAAASDSMTPASLMDQLRAELAMTEAPCPEQVIADRIGAVVSCGRVELDLRDFRAKVDELSVKLVNNAGEWKHIPASTNMYYGDGRPVRPEEEYVRGVLVDGRKLVINYFPRSRSVVMSYTLPLPMCDVTDPVKYPDGLVPPSTIPVSKKQPVFPELARRARVEGFVVLRVIVGTDGAPHDACILRGTGDGALGFEAAALDAVKDWRFVPATRDGQAVEAPMDLALQFRLRQ